MKEKKKYQNGLLVLVVKPPIRFQQLSKKPNGFIKLVKLTKLSISSPNQRSQHYHASNAGEAFHSAHIATSWRRQVRWLNGWHGIPAEPADPSAGNDSAEVRVATCHRVAISGIHITTGSASYDVFGWVIQRKQKMTFKTNLLTQNLYLHTIK